MSRIEGSEAWRAGVTLSALCAGALLLGGCGGGPKPLSKAAYTKEMVALGRELSTEMSPVSEATTAKGAAAALTKARAALESVAEELSAIRAPTAVASDQSELAAAVSQYAQSLGAVISELDKGDFSAVNQILTVKGFAEIGTASEAIIKAGYPIAPPSSSS